MSESLFSSIMCYVYLKLHFLNYAEEAGISSPNHPSVVGVLPQPCSQGNRQDYLPAVPLGYSGFAIQDCKFNV